MSRSDEQEAALRKLFAAARSMPSDQPQRFDLVVDRLYRTYSHEVLALAHRLVPQVYAEDVANETWAAIPRALETFEGDAAFRTWLERIVAHKAGDLLRRIKDKRYERLSEVCSKTFRLSQPTASGVLANKERAGLVDEMIAELDPDDRDLVERHYKNDESVADIARALGLAPNTIAQRLVRIRKRMKQLCAEAGISRA